MVLILLALVLIFVGFPLVLRLYYSASAKRITDQQRKSWRLALMALGACGFGIIGFLAAIAATLVIGVMLIGNRFIGGRAEGEEIANLIVAAGTLLSALAGAWVGYAADRWVARRSSVIPAPDAP
jgi:hypothetical protein